MNFSCTQENLNRGLSITGHIASKNVNLPILNNILIKAENKILELSATNLEIGIKYLVRGKVEKDGSFTINSRLISDYLSLLPKEQIDAELLEEEQSLKIDCKNFKTKIKGLPASEFPLLPSIKKENPYILKIDQFREALSQIIFTVAQNEIRQEISGVFFNFTINNNAGKLVLAGTDGHRLAEKTFSLNNIEGLESKKTIIPVKTLQELLRILGFFKEEENGMIEIYLTENQILFICNGVELISRVIEEQYPDYLQIIPQNYKTQGIVNKEDLINAVKATSLFTKIDINDLSLDIKKEENKIIIFSTNAQIGENTAEVEANITGDNNIVSLNYRYLLDGLMNINSSEVVLEIIDPNTPVLLKPALKESQERDYLYVIMPIKQ